MNTLLHERALPPLLSREEMLNILQREEYGYLPPKPDSLVFEVTENIIRNFCAGKAVCSKITAHITLNGKSYSFPFHEARPTCGTKHPFFVHINFRDNIPDRYMPTEELIDNGFAVLSFCYHDVTKDNGDFTDGLAGILYTNGKRRPSDPGKLAMWAWAAQRIMDYAQSQNEAYDMARSTVCGHSRLGKTALLAAATDRRFAFAYSNNSGCSGAAITRNKRGEHISDICKRFSYWFCENYKKYADHEQNMPFDQHYLIASIAPRYVLVGSASEDQWADPLSEQLACLAAAPAFKKGFVCAERPAEIGEAFFDGDIGYHLRHGLHYFSREDWNRLIRFVSLHQLDNPN